MRKTSYLAALALLYASTAFSQNLTIQTWAGGGIPVNLNAASASLGYISGVAIYGGNIYLSLQAYSVVVMWNPSSGNLTLVAGNGSAGYSGDLGPATTAQLNNPWGIAFDAFGNLYIADSANNRIRKVAVSTGIITTLLGSGNISLNQPTGVAADVSGNIYIADTGNNLVRKYSNGVTTTVAGAVSGGIAQYSGVATQTLLSAPTGVAVDTSGNFYIADYGYNLVRKVTNGALTSPLQVSGPVGVAVDAAGDFFVAAWGTDVVGEYTVGGVISTVAGNQAFGYTGDGGAAVSAELNSPAGVAVDPSGNVYIADYNNYVLREVTGGIINTVAGTIYTSAVGDNGPATSAILFSPSYTATGPAGELYIVDANHNTVRKVLNGVITTVAGTGAPGYAGDNGLATGAQLNSPWGVAVDSSGNLYISDSGNNVIRKVTNGIITTFAGNTAATALGDGGAATLANLSGPAGVTLDAAGNLYIADFGNSRVREVGAASLTINTVAGNGNAGYNGDGIVPTTAELNGPIDVKLDALGNLYIADQTNNLIRIVSAGVINTFAGLASNAASAAPGGFGGDGGAATSALLNGPSGIAINATTGAVYIADTSNNVIREVSGGVINTIAGNGAPAYGGDGGPATAASVNFPDGVSVGPGGQIFIADSHNNLIRAMNLVCNYSVTPPSIQAGASGGNFNINVQTASYCSWTISGLPAWATVPAGVSNTGPLTVNLVVAPDSGAARGATITVAGSAVAVNQAACTYALSPGGQAFPAIGGSGTVAIITAGVCPWSVTNVPSWVTITGALSGTGSGSLNFTVLPNAAATDQAGTLTIAGLAFTVQQQSSSIPGLSLIGSMPHIAAEENWITTFTLVNKSAASPLARLSFFGDPSDASGNGPLTLPVAFPQQPSATGALLATSFDQSIAANASLVVATAGPQTPPVQVGSAQMSATGDVDGFAIFHLIPGAQEAVVPMETRNADSYILAFDNTGGVVLGVAVANVSAQAGNVGIIIRDDTGTKIASGAISLPGNGHTSFDLSDSTAGFPVTANKRGTVEFDTPAGGQISVLGIRTTPLGASKTLTTIPALANVGITGGSIAHIATGNGWQTTFVLVNTGTTAASVDLNFLADVTGAPLTLPISFPQVSGTVTNASSVSQMLAAGATLLVQSVAPPSNPAPTTGSAQLTTSGNVSGFVIFRYNPNGQEAVVPLESRVANGFLIAFDNTSGTATGIALNSVSAQAVNVPVIVRDDTGNQLTTDTLTLQANGHLSFTLGSCATGCMYPQTANLRGTIEFDTPSGGQIGTLGIRIPVGHTFTTLPALAK
jgi:trimeric autotransporter adhesin